MVHSSQTPHTSSISEERAAAALRACIARGTVVIDGTAPPASPPNMPSGGKLPQLSAPDISILERSLRDRGVIL